MQDRTKNWKPPQVRDDGIPWTEHARAMMQELSNLGNELATLHVEIRVHQERIWRVDSRILELYSMINSDPEFDEGFANARLEAARAGQRPE